MIDERLAASIRRYYQAVTHRTSTTPRASVGHAPMETRSWLFIAAATIVVLALIGTILVLSPGDESADDRTTTTLATTTSEASGSTTTTTVASGGTTTTPASSGAWTVNPLLSPYFTLPACDREPLLTSWINTHAPSGTVDGTPSEVPLRDVIQTIPIYRATAAVCADALTYVSNGGSGAMGWLLLDSEGELVARAVGWVFVQQLTDTPLAEDPVLVAMNGEYHQDRMPSGHPFTGWVADRLVAADTKPDQARREFARFFIEVPDYVLPGAGGGEREGNRAGELISRLSLADLAPSNIGDQMFTPATLPSGYARCWGPYPWSRIEPIEEPGTVTMYCNADGDRIRLGVHINPAEYQSLGVTKLGELDFDVVHVDDERRVLIGGTDNQQGVTMAIEAPISVTTEELDDMVRSVPALDPRNRTPAEGSSDLREVFSEEWVVGVITATGAADIESSDRYHSTLAFTWRPDPTSNGRVLGSFALYDDVPANPSLDTTEIFTYAGVDVFVTRVPGNRASQAIARCGGLTVNVIFNGGEGDPVITAVRAFIGAAGC